VNVPNADLALTGSATPNPVAKGGQLTYKFTVKNNGPLSATATTLTVTLPAAVTLPLKAPAGCSFLGHGMNCTLGALTKSASKVVTVVVKAPNTGGTTLTANGATSSGVTDLNGGNNETSASAVTKT
jgi:uncharacterized repeat protein (TIGR01451 family)